MQTKTEKYLMVAIISLSVLLLVLCVYFIYKYEAIVRAERMQADIHLIAIERNHGPLPVSDAQIIESWMTFDYINYIFNLPASYLKSQLSIIDTRYPRLTIEEYSEGQATSTTSFLSTIRGYVSRYHK